ncbi:MAG: adenine phosphoribosyltransferase [Aequorivita sp.]|jgi:adenine phosphoribosyltransferase|nr:adenine phosphoribosyltransferase [Aequorivita sp.]MAO48880.1 adenine phosphoribosyltransferase [Aequorivita sp.]MBF29730.1 adenine phosphoribosyltransferase [Aequorivita sp.]|tara:strand:- start:85147 stop:85659 length:513 start_codon:yes stop_codon:yes gene_type:complete
MDLTKYIRNIENFPKAGVHFKDITPLLGDSEAVASCVEQLVVLIGDKKIDKVAAIESRGFFFGTLLAQKLNAGFVPIRKPGKLPYKTRKEPYQLEYGLDALEIHEDAIKKGERVLLHDDVLATGGTARAACNLIEQLGGEIVQCNFLLELEFLNGINKLRSHPVQSLLKF